MPASCPESAFLTQDTGNPDKGCKERQMGASFDLWPYSSTTTTHISKLIFFRTDWINSNYNHLGSFRISNFTKLMTQVAHWNWDSSKTVPWPIFPKRNEEQSCLSIFKGLPLIRNTGLPGSPLSGTMPHHDLRPKPGGWLSGGFSVYDEPAQAVSRCGYKFT